MLKKLPPKRRGRRTRRRSNLDPESADRAGGPRDGRCLRDVGRQSILNARSASKQKKRRSKEERLDVPQQPQEPLNRFEETTKALRALKAEFDAAHAEGMRALKKRDLDGFARAIKLERNIVKRQQDRLAAQRKKTT